MTNQVGHVFLATELCKSTQRLEDSEAIRVQWVPMVDAINLVTSGEVLNVGTAYGLLLAEKKWKTEARRRS